MISLCCEHVLLLFAIIATYKHRHIHRRPSRLHQRDAIREPKKVLSKFSFFLYGSLNMSQYICACVCENVRNVCMCKCVCVCLKGTCRRAPLRWWWCGAPCPHRQMFYVHRYVLCVRQKSATASLSHTAGPAWSRHWPDIYPTIHNNLSPSLLVDKFLSRESPPPASAHCLRTI